MGRVRLRLRVRVMGRARARIRVGDSVPARFLEVTPRTRELDRVRLVHLHAQGGEELRRGGASALEQREALELPLDARACSGLG